ncbi:MAG TPA: phytoene/squalene synthase family protein [archaeon]|nr:phytoene/squalene synthase family protein [archaeon]
MKKNNKKIKYSSNLIFKKGSKTYFYSSYFFPKKIRKDVTTLYAFVRTVDNLVDSVPQKKKEFFKFKKQFINARKGKKIQNPIITNFLELEKRKNFEKKWANSFMESMQKDLKQKKYKNLKEVEKYMHGSAEVIGLFMCKILDINKSAYKSAKLLGKAMQYINFIRDIDEDIALNRCYFPENELKKHGFKCFDKESMKTNKEGFSKFIKEQIKHYKKWQNTAEKDFSKIDKKYLPSIKTASEMYKWTAKRIENDPQIVFREKVKPAKSRIFITGIKNLVKKC